MQADELQDYVGDTLFVRYSIRERKYVKVYTQKGKYIATATARESVHAMIHLSDDLLQDGRKLENEIKDIKRLEKRIRQDSAELDKKLGKGMPTRITTEEVKQLMQNPDMIEAPPEPERISTQDIEQMMREEVPEQESGTKVTDIENLWNKVKHNPEYVEDNKDKVTLKDLFDSVGTKEVG